MRQTERHRLGQKHKERQTETETVCGAGTQTGAVTLSITYTTTTTTTTTTRRLQDDESVFESFASSLRLSQHRGHKLNPLRTRGPAQCRFCSVTEQNKCSL